MRKCCTWLAGVVSCLVWTGCDTIQGPSTARAAPAPQMASAPAVEPRQVELANLRADVQLLDRRLRETEMAMEDLARQNRELTASLDRQQRASAGQMGDVVRQAQLNQAIAEAQQRSQAADAELRRQIIAQVTQQIEQLGRQTQAAIDAVARNQAARPTTATTAARQPNFSDDFPREGISYTVQRGDTLSGIASRNNSTVRDIQNANQISDPGAIQVGQVLFIPQRRN
jgi:LysM repeat protein